MSISDFLDKPLIDDIENISLDDFEDTKDNELENISPYDFMDDVE